MHPFLTIPWLDVAVRTQPLVFWFGVFAATILGPRWIARREHLDLARVRKAQLWLTLASLAGARLHFLFNNPHFYGDNPLRMLNPIGGMHVGGALIGVLVATPFIARRYDLDLAKLCDGIIPMAGVCLADARLGCLLGGCCFGTHCDRPWSITYPPGSIAYVMQQQAGSIAADATASLPLHPTPLYFALAALFSAVTSAWIAKHKRYDGQAFWAGLAILTATATLIEPFRALENHYVFWAGVPQLVWTQLAIIAVALTGLAVGEWRHHRRASARSGLPDLFPPARTGEPTR
jgi:phosphatidylglycerol:prolipoprotein diacylglycerol transferase